MYENLKKKIKAVYHQENFLAARLGINKATLQSRLRGIAKWKPDEIEIIKKNLDYDLRERND